MSVLPYPRQRNAIQQPLRWHFEGLFSADTECVGFRTRGCTGNDADILFYQCHCPPWSFNKELRVGWPKNKSCFSIIPRIYQAVSATYGDQVTGRSWQLQRVRRCEPENTVSKMKVIFLIRTHNRTDGADVCDKLELGVPAAAQRSSDPGASGVWRAGWPEAASCSVLR